MNTMYDKTSIKACLDYYVLHTVVTVCYLVSADIRVNKWTKKNEEMP